MRRAVFEQVRRRRYRCDSSSFVPLSLRFSSSSTDHHRDVYHRSRKFRLDLGGELPELQVKYATWGLDDPSKRIVFICPSMSNTPFPVDAGEEKGWWNHVVGRGKEKGINLDDYAVVCASPLGSPHGSTSPIVGPVRGRDFPDITPLDMARAHAALLDHLDISKVHAVIGGSMGGMQALHFAAEFPDRFEKCVAIASTAHTSPGTVALRHVQRQAVKDLSSSSGLRIARMVGTIGYRSREEFDERFNWDAFDVAGYLEAQADKFETSGYDADCYLLLSLAMDMMALPAEKIGDRCAGKGKEFLLLPYSTDRLMPPNESLSLARALQDCDVDVHCEIIKTQLGHDAFLAAKASETGLLNDRLSAFLKSGVKGVRRAAADSTSAI